MAGFREHVTVSGLLGAAYGATATISLGFAPAVGGLAACVTWVGGMLPDLDSQSGRPVRELFALTAAFAPLLLADPLRELGGSREAAMLLAIGLYLTIRYGCAWVLGKLAVHRGMFHSLPALLIAAELVFLGYRSESPQAKLLMAGGVGLGFFSHLLLDELYSVQLSGVRVKLNQFAGSALKLSSRSLLANFATYSLLTILTYATLLRVGWIELPESAPPRLQRTAEDARPPGR